MNDLNNKVQEISPNIPVNYDNLRYRSQFVLGSSFVGIFSSPQCHVIRPGIKLTTHPELNVTVARYQCKTLVLVGCMLDPYNPGASDSEIVELLIQRIDNCFDLLTETGRFGGRWVLIAEDGTNSILFSDPAGLRQVFYNMPMHDAPLWCGTQPHVLAGLLGIDKDSEAVELLQSPRSVANKEYLMPGDRTLYKDIRHLLPNHFLDLNTGTSKRYWPHKNISHLSMDVAIPRCADLLRGLLASAANRYDLAMALTAGSDSRLLLAASKTLKQQIVYFTVKTQAGNLTEDHPDLAIPRELSQYLGLKYDVIEQPTAIDKQFANVFKENTSLAHEVWCPDTQAIYDFYGMQKATLPGVVSEISKNMYQLPYFIERTMTGETIAPMLLMDRALFSVKAIQEWLDDVGQPFNIRRLDLLLWEQRVGNWCAMGQQEFDIAWKEIISLFNCRLLLTTMMSVPRKFRTGPNFILNMNLTRYLWPEVLNIPINPHKVVSLNKTTRKYLRNHLSNIKQLLHILHI